MSVHIDGEVYIDAPELLPPAFVVTDELLERIRVIPHGEPLGWGATPLDPYDNDTRVQQLRVNRAISKRFDTNAPTVPESLADYVYSVNQARVHHRLTENYKSFSHRGVLDTAASGYPDESTGEQLLPEYVHRSLTGHASPAEALVTAAALRIPTIELASLTHAYKVDREKLAAMREAVHDSILLLDGEVYNKPPDYQIKAANFLHGNVDIPALHMTRTFHIGCVNERLNVLERSSFVVRLDALPRELSGMIMQQDFNKDWEQSILAAPGFETVIATLLDEDDFDAAIPISTTTFAADSLLVEEYLENDAVYRQKQRAHEQCAYEKARNNDTSYS